MLGNIRRQAEYTKKFEEMKEKQLCETVTITRLESQRVRMRKTTNKGTDVGIDLPKGTKLRHGDVVLQENDKMIVVEIEPEDVLHVKVKENIPHHHAVEVPIRLGHTIGNLHRPLKLDHDSVYFPIQSDDEVNMFKTFFGSIAEYLELNKIKIVFEPEEGMDAHEH